MTAVAYPNSEVFAMIVQRPRLFLSLVIKKPHHFLLLPRMQVCVDDGCSRCSRLKVCSYIDGYGYP